MDQPPELAAPRAPERIPSLAVLQDALSHAAEPLVAAHLRVSVRTLRRYVAGDLKMNWVTRTRLDGLVAELAAKRLAEQELARERARAARRRQLTPRGYTPAVA